MAKRHKAKKTTHRRRKRSSMHGVADVATRVAALAAGAVVGAYVNNMAKTSFPTLPTWAGGAAVMAAGVAIPMFVKGNALVEGFGNGMAAAGGVFVLNETFLSVPGISGIGAVQLPQGYFKKSVGAPGFFNNPVGGMKDLNTVGALYDN